ncbi:hypothetical protein [Hymenobacter negativus]|uniref:Right-handed parallel beta-helix repeat-containing protein n=1 Tax=Hymenobacter negativus TaxID=2795026 RepID=A0ABS0Q9N2_9BACT|nr:hypothetical protein [Hymenobacter negativus]MBH8559388.1 hypothetical protein [Hymenobacter negativus]
MSLPTFWPRPAARALVLLALTGAGLASACGRHPSGPAQLIVRKGGTYTGTFGSTDSSLPCVSIQTTEPVTLSGCVLAGAGNLIEATRSGAQLTIVNCQGYGLAQSLDNIRHGHFLEANSAKSVRVEHNYFEHTSGISIYQWSGDGTPAQTLTVRYNSARNIDGRYRNGGSTPVNFLGLNGLPNLAGIEVAWNQVINEPNQSLVEDNINFFNSGGTRTSPARLHDNYIQGAYPIPATSDTYAGSGITLDGTGRAPITTTAWVEGYDNQLVSTCAALNIASGHDNHFHHNRIITSGLLPDGTRLAANYAGIGVWNAYKQPPTVFFHNHVSDNVVGFVHWGGSTPLPNRQDLSTGACPTCTATTHLPNPVTLQTEQAEWALWQRKLRAQHVHVGPAATSALPRMPPQQPLRADSGSLRSILTSFRPKLQ